MRHKYYDVLLFFVVILIFSTKAFTLDVVDIAVEQLGKPYDLGFEGPDFFDCSGLVWYAYTQIGFTFSRTTALEFSRQVGSLVTGELQRGDLLFFETIDSKPGVVTHVGIYEADNMMINAEWYGRGVRRADLTSDYWSTRFLFARRILSEPMPSEPVLDQEFNAVDQGPTDSVVGAGICDPSAIPFSRHGQWTQTFLAGLTGELASIELKVSGAGGNQEIPNGTILMVDIVSTANNEIPDLNMVLGTGTFTAGDIPPGFNPSYIGVSIGGVQLVAGASYAIIAHRPGEGCYSWVLDQNGGYNDGIAYFFNDQGGITEEGDLSFRTFVIPK